MYRNYDETIEHRSASCSDIKKVGPKKNLPTNGRMHGLVSFSFGRGRDPQLPSCSIVSQ